MAKELSVRQFSERLDSRLGEMSIHELRAWVREAASELQAEKRQGFLNSLWASAETPAAQPPKDGSLSREIAALRRKLELAMGKEPEWGYEDDGEPNSFHELLPESERLFGRARALFRKADFKAAADAYRALFELSAIDDEYGRSMGLPERLDTAEERARFLRSVVESSGSDRGRNLLSAWGHLVDREDVDLANVFEITPAQIPDMDALLDELIHLLEEQRDDECDAWLQQATKLRFGVEGLERLARRSGSRRPYAWVNWVAAVAEIGDPRQTAAAADEALRSLPARLSLRAHVAENAYNAAAKLKEPERALAARWEGYCAAPSTRSLLDLWDAAGQDRCGWMARAAAEPLPRPPEAEWKPYVGRFGNPVAGIDPANWPFEPDDGKHVFGRSTAVWHAEASAKLRVLAHFLAGDWEAAWKRARGEKVLGWSSWESSQSLVVPVLFACLSGAPNKPLPPAVDGLWKTALRGADNSPFEPDVSSESDERQTCRLSNALGESMKSWTPDSATATAAVQLAIRRVDAIVGEKHRGAYERAAYLAIAATEVLERQGKGKESQHLLTSVIDRHRRKYAFTGEVKRAQERLARP
jgi:tetratricopeptide (TPR) repeat protein